MKTLSEICQLAKKEYIIGKRLGIWVHPGMCSAVKELRTQGIFTLVDKEKFMKEYRKFAKNRRVFYDRQGNKSTSSSQFAWNPKNRPARIKWFNQRI